MVEVIVFAEGPTEEQFIKRVVAPALRHLQIFLKAQTLRTSQQARGGAVSFDRLKFNARNTLRGQPEVILSTFLDLYGLDTSFPGHEDAKRQADLYRKVEHLESALHASIVEQVQCRPNRFIPHIQPHEFEGLLFSDVAALASTQPSWGGKLTALKQVRDAAESPEHINDGFETKPSRRLEDMLLPRYRKTLHGPVAAERITLGAMERECIHFRGWLDRLRALRPA